MKQLTALFLLALAVPAFAQPRLISPEVHSDRRVTFRLRAPNAKQVTLRLEATQVPPMQKDDQGVWSVTTEPLPPDYYAYSLNVDGVQMMDSGNPLIKRNLFNSESMVHVPGRGLPWDVVDVPHGVLHRHFYHSAIIGDDRPYIVYTPPGYDPTAKEPYPVLYLLHGFSDTEDAWTSIGQANIILDNQIAQGIAKPMLIVMPLGYGNRQIMTGGWGAVNQRDIWQDSIEKFRDALLKEVIPQVEKAYRVSADRTGRAITGLSMGGTQSLYIGLNALERFAWIGAFSSGGMDPNFEKSYPAVNESTNAQLRLLWIACGQQDGLLSTNQRLVDWLKNKKVNPTWVTIPGGHSFMVWRRFLAQFAPLLFRDNPAADARENRFFPRGVFVSDYLPLDTAVGEAYSRHLTAMGERSLSDGKNACEFAYRFLWLRSLRRPISIRIQKGGPAVTLRAVELDGGEGQGLRKIAREVNRELSPSEIEMAVGKVAKAGFWQMKAAAMEDRLATGGSCWIMEGSQGGAYHVVDRLTPGSGDFKELGLCFIQLSGFTVPEKEVY